MDDVPGSAKRGAGVTDLEVAAHEQPEEFAMGPVKEHGLGLPGEMCRGTSYRCDGGQSTGMWGEMLICRLRVSTLRPVSGLIGTAAVLPHGAIRRSDLDRGCGGGVFFWG